MNRIRFHQGLGAAALALLLGGVARADGPAPAGPAGPCCAAEACGAPAGCCAAEGCCPTCTPAPVTRKVVLRHYSDKCEDFCLCRPTFLGGLLNVWEAREKDRDLYVGRGPGDKPCCEGECGCCAGCTECGRIHYKKFLLIHNREHSECEMQCQSPDQLAAAARGGSVGGPANAPGTPRVSPRESADEPRTPGLNPQNGLPNGPSGGQNGPSGSPGTGNPQAAPGENPQPRTPRLDPGR